MLNLSADFRTRTNVGLTNCYHATGVTGNYRDCSSVDYAVAYVKKVFSKVNNNPCVTISANYTIGRIFEEYKDGKKGYTYIMLDGSSTRWVEKLTAVDIKVFYLNCADKAIEIEKAS